MRNRHTRSSNENYKKLFDQNVDRKGLNKDYCLKNPEKTPLKCILKALTDCAEFFLNSKLKLTYFKSEFSIQYQFT